MSAKTMTVPDSMYEATVRQWARRRYVATASGPGWTVLAAPPAREKTAWRAGKLTVLTLGLYPLLWLVWVLGFAWWMKPIMAASRASTITVMSASHSKTAAPPVTT